MTQRLLRSIAVMTVLWLCAGCGGGSKDDSNKIGHVRLVNATEVSNLVLNAQGKDNSDYTYSSSAGAPGAASGYTDYKTQSYSIVVSAQDGSLTASSTTTLSVAEDDYYTVVAYQRGGVVRLVQLTDEESAPSSGYAKLKAVNADTDAGTVDVYLVPPGSSLDNRSPVFSSLATANSSLMQSQTAGTYDIVVTAANKQADIRLRLASVSLTSGEVVSLLLTPTSGGALLDGVLVQQRSGSTGGAVDLRRNGQARVRVIAGLENSGTPYAVQVTVGSQDLGTVISPSAGTYSLVSADTASYSVAVNSVAVSNLPTNTFTSGGDYTILIYDSSLPKAAVLSDKNQVPSSGATIRLVNAAIPTGVSLSVNYVPLFSQVAQGKASDYSGISSGTTTLSLSSPAWSGYKDKSSVSITSGGVYSYFILGTGTDETTTLSLILNRDR